MFVWCVCVCLWCLCVRAAARAPALTVRLPVCPLAVDYSASFGFSANVDSCGNQMVPCSIPGGRMLISNWKGTDMEPLQ